MKYYKTSKGYYYKIYQNGKKIRISKNFFNKKNKMIGGLFKRGSHVECKRDICFKKISPGIKQSETGYVSKTQKLLVKKKITFKDKEWKVASNQWKKIKDDFSIEKYNIDNKWIIYELEYTNNTNGQNNNNTVYIEEKSLRNWTEDKIMPLNESTIDKLNLLYSHNFILLAHGSEHFFPANFDLHNEAIGTILSQLEICFKQFLVNIINEYIKKFEKEIKSITKLPDIIIWHTDNILKDEKWEKETKYSLVSPRATDRDYFDQMMNLYKSDDYRFKKYAYTLYEYIERLYKDLDGQSLENIIKEYNNRDSGKRTEESSEIKIPTKEIFNLYNKYIMGGKNLKKKRGRVKRVKRVKKNIQIGGEKYFQIYFETLKEMLRLQRNSNDTTQRMRSHLKGDTTKSIFSKYIKEFETKLEEIKENFISLNLKKRMLLKKQFRDIILYKDQKVILKCDAGCILRRNEIYFLDTLSNGGKMKDILKHLLDSKGKYCIFEDKVPNLTLQFTQSSKHIDYNIYGIYELPVEFYPNKEKIEKKKNRRLVDKNIKSFHFFTGLTSYDTNYTLETVIEIIRTKIGKESPFVLYVNACREASHSVDSVKYLHLNKLPQNIINEIEQEKIKEKVKKEIKRKLLRLPKLDALSK